MKFAHKFVTPAYKPLLANSKQVQVGYHLKYVPNQNIINQEFSRTSFFFYEPSEFMPPYLYDNNEFSENLYKLSSLQQFSCSKYLIHAPYSMNLGTRTFAAIEWAQSRLLYEAHQTRMCGQKYLNIHGGCSKEWESKHECFQQIAKILDFVLERVPEVIILIEAMVGGKKDIIVGSSFKEINDIIKLSRHPQRLGVCVDTAHCWAGRFCQKENFAESLLAAFRQEFQGFPQGLHLNNSLSEYGSQIDRHAMINQGTIPVQQLQLIAQWDVEVIVMEIEENEEELNLVQSWVKK